jgi:SAM-dependent methyltransferase
VPKEDPAAAVNFYQKAYKAGFASDMPPAPALAGLLEKKFIGSDGGDYSARIAVCQAVGLKPGDVILDFGCSWGYGSWQLRQAGFCVYSFEVSRARAGYARSSLGCETVDNLSTLDGKVDCFFSSHVIEHLPNPTTILEMARKALRPGGVGVTFCPNGDPSSAWSDHYGDLLGKHHPSVITPAFLRHACAVAGFTVNMYSNPYDLDGIANAVDAGALPGDELCAVMRKV